LKLFRKNTFLPIESNRLLLRKPQLKDAASYHHILSCTEICHFSDLPYKPTFKRSEQFVRWMSKLDSRDIGAAWLICLKTKIEVDRNIGIRTTSDPQSDNAIIGSIRINSIEKKANCGRLGYELHPSYWGQGYATEALGVVISHAYNHLSLNRLEAWTIDGNDASNRVLLNNGFQYEGMQREKVLVRDKYQNVRLFGHLASDRY